MFAQNLPPQTPKSNRRIIPALVEATANIDTTINRARRQIESWQVYRTRLIADVVTGKIDVQEPNT